MPGAAGILSDVGVASATDSGRIRRITPAKMMSEVCQPVPSIRPRASGENRNWPNEPAAVPAPKASERQLSGTSLPNAPITRLKEQPDRPKPIKTPADKVSVVGDVE